LFAGLVQDLERFLRLLGLEVIQEEVLIASEANPGDFLIAERLGRRLLAPACRAESK